MEKLDYTSFYKKYYKGRIFSLSICELERDGNECFYRYLYENLKKGDIVSLVEFLKDFARNAFFRVIIGEELMCLLNTKEISFENISFVIDSYPAIFLLSPEIIGLNDQ